MIMKKIAQRIIVAVVALCVTQVAMAESWRINNDVTKGAHFSSINDAMASESVVDGDTLYLDPGCVLSADQTISKAVTVIGTGWDYIGKPYVAARIDKPLYVTAKATLIGLWINSYFYLRCTGVVVERCKVSDFTYVGNNATAQNVEIRQCYITNPIIGYESKSSGLKIYNSYIYGYTNPSKPIIRDLSEVEIINNIIIQNAYASDDVILSNLSDAVIKNNIIVYTRSDKINLIYKSFTNCLMYNNVLSADPASWSYVSTYPNNVFANSAKLTTYIVNSGAGGANLQLCENSPAKGAGEGGIDCGPYAEGSLYPFVTYGLPEHIPHFTEAVIPANPTDGKVKVTLKIENQNR